VAVIPSMTGAEGLLHFSDGITLLLLRRGSCNGQQRSQDRRLYPSHDYCVESCDMNKNVNGSCCPAGPYKRVDGDNVRGKPWRQPLDVTHAGNNSSTKGILVEIHVSQRGKIQQQRCVQQAQGLSKRRRSSNKPLYQCKD
jgi:hypothetical protein